MIDDPSPAVAGNGAGRRAARIARADTHVPTPRAAGGRTRTRSHLSHEVVPRDADRGATPASNEESARWLAAGAGFVAALVLARILRRR